MIVQIYEVQNPKEAKKLVELGVDHIGVLVGKGKYPRELTFNQAKKIFRSLPKKAKKVALSLSSDLKEVSEVIEKTKPDILQIGTFPEKISPSDVAKLKKRFPRLKVMRVIPVIDEESIKIAKQYDGIADFLLLDTYQKGDSLIGATGRVHNWDISQRIVKVVKTPVILAGGLGPDNVAEAIKKVKPVGVDSKTKTDRIDGKGKDFKKVEKFVNIAKSFK